MRSAQPNKSKSVQSKKELNKATLHNNSGIHTPTSTYSIKIKYQRAFKNSKGWTLPF